MAYERAYNREDKSKDSRDSRDSYSRDNQRYRRGDENDGRHRGVSGWDRRDSREKKPYRDHHRRSRSPRRSRSRSRSPQRSPPVEIKPDFSNSGLLAAESKTVNGVVLKYHEPPEAQKPGKKDDWRLFAFEGEKKIHTDMVMLDKQSCYLIGKDTNVADYPITHASVSKQHAVIQYRTIRSKNEFGDMFEEVK